MIGALLTLTFGLSAGANADVDFFMNPSRHADFAQLCARKLKAGQNWATPKLAAAAAWAAPKIEHVAHQSKSALEHAAGVLLEGSYADRLSHNRTVIMKNYDEPEEVGDAGEVVLKAAMRELYPEWARNVRIVFRDHEMSLFVGRDVKATVFPPRTPILVRRGMDVVVDGLVPSEVLERLIRHARQGS